MFLDCITIKIITNVLTFFKSYASGDMMTGSLKMELIKILQKLVGDHRKKRAEVTDEMVRQFMKPRKLKFDYPPSGEQK